MINKKMSKNEIKYSERFVLSRKSRMSESAKISKLLKT